MSYILQGRTKCGCPDVITHRDNTSYTKVGDIWADIQKGVDDVGKAITDIPKVFEDAGQAVDSGFRALTGQSQVKAGGKCPGFISKELVDVFAEHRLLWQAVTLFLDILGWAFIGSIFLAPLGLGLGAISGAIKVLIGKCDAGETGKVVFEVAAAWCAIAIVALSAVGAAAVISTAAAGGTITASLGAGAAPGGIAGLLKALQPVFESLGQGKTPSVTQVASLGFAAASQDGNSPEIRESAQLMKNVPVDAIAKEVKKTGVKMPSTKDLDKVNTGIAGERAGVKKATSTSGDKKDAIRAAQASAERLKKIETNAKASGAKIVERSSGANIGLVLVGLSVAALVAAKVSK